jgi:xanthine dehydrogenase iron-sulfur cluster and FAD-binding subunit A
MRASADYRMAVARNLLQKFYLETSSNNLAIDVRAISAVAQMDAS